MKLTRLRIQQLPGIDSEFSVENLDPGINLVTGPNAIGKSSLIRALQYLIATPDGSDPDALAMDADLENGGHWTVKRTGRGYEWQRDGQRAERPRLPERDSLHCYWLTMEDLVRVSDNDRQLMEQLRQALAGGYDLPALRGGEFELRPRIGNNEARRLDDTAREQRRIETEYRELRQREASLPALEERIERAQRAGIHAEHLEQALELLGLLEQRNEIRAALRHFPACTEKLLGNEGQLLTQLEQEREQLQREQEAARRTRQDAEATLKDTGLADSRPDNTALQAHRRELDDLAHTRKELADKCEERDRVLAEEHRALQSLGGNNEPPRLEPDAIKEAETLAARLDKLRHQCRETEARLQKAGDAPDEDSLSRHRLAINALLDWLAAGQGGKGNTLTVMIAVVAGLAAAGLALAAKAWFAAGAAVVAVIAAGLSFRKNDQTGTADARRTFEKQQLESPADWRRPAVQQALQTLQKQFDELRLRHQNALAAGNDRERLADLQEQLRQQEQEKQQLAEALGFDPALTALGLDHFVRQVEQYQRAAEQRQALDKTIERLEKDIETTLESVRQFLTQWHVNATGRAELDAALAELTERTRRAEDALNTMARMDTDLARLQKDSNDRETRIDALYQEAGLEPGDRRALEDGLEQRDAWKAQQQQLRENELREGQCRQALADEPALITQAEQGEREALEKAREQAREHAAELETLRDERSQIRTDVRNAGGSRALEKAGAEVDKARTELEDRMNEQLFAEAGQFLLDEVEREHHTEHEPEVLRDARERFQRFTHHAWDLSLGDNTLRARDLKQNSLRELTELSSGTRMQLLLAVRLAWTRHLEQNLSPLPLFLDEALTTADEKRFAAVAESLETLARDEGRQVFYLSARRQELGLWEKVTGHRPHHIDLAAIRGRQPATTDDAYLVPVEDPLPEPKGKKPEQYAKELGVPPVQPTQSAAGLHLFHLLRDDLELLHRLMQDWNVSTLGQLQNLLDSPVAAQAIPDADQRHKLTGRGHAAIAWINAWRQGRGKPVDRIALEQSGAVSPNYIEEVTALAEEKGGDAEAIIDALNNKAVSGFRTNKIEALKEFFEQEGYIDPAAPLKKEDRQRRTLLTAGDKASPFDIRQTTVWLEAATP